MKVLPRSISDPTSPAQKRASTRSMSKAGRKNSTYQYTSDPSTSAMQNAKVARALKKLTVTPPLSGTDCKKSVS